jgi:hypothetical protein
VRCTSSGAPEATETELDLAQLSVAPLWWAQATGHALVLTVRVIDHQLDRIDPLGRTIGGRPTSARKLGQL